MAVLLQQKNFGPNVIYFVVGTSVGTTPSPPRPPPPPPTPDTFRSDFWPVRRFYARLSPLGGNVPCRSRKCSGPPPGTPLPKSWPIYFSEQNYYFSNQHDFFGAPEAEGRRGLVSSDFYETLKLLISNTRYMTLGPKFYTKLVSAITRRRMHLNQWFRCESAPFFA